MRIHRMGFSLLLPILELTIWLVLVPSQGFLNYLRFRQMAHGASKLDFQIGEFAIALRRNGFLGYALEAAAMRESEIVSAMNIPGIFIEAPVSSLIEGSPHGWHPYTWTWAAWRAISFPFFALPAWWFAGRGLDGLLGWRRPRWWTLLVGTLLCAGFLTLLLGFRFGMSPEDRVGTGWVILGFALWTLLFAAFPAAWVRRGIERPRSAVCLPE